MKKILISAAILILSSCSENKVVRLGSATTTEVTPSFSGNGLGRAVSKDIIDNTSKWSIRLSDDKSDILYIANKSTGIWVDFTIAGHPGVSFGSGEGSINHYLTGDDLTDFNEGYDVLINRDLNSESEYNKLMNLID